MSGFARVLFVSDPRKSIGMKIRELRMAQGLSQEELAEKSGLHRNYIGGIERGERNVALINIVEISRALRVTPSELLREIR